LFPLLDCRNELAPVNEMVSIPKYTTDAVIEVRAVKVIMPKHLLERTPKQMCKKERVS
jgi:hypothetical protein